LPDAPAQWGQAVSDASRMPRRSVAGVLGATAGVQFLMRGHTDDLEFTWHLITVIRWARARFGAAPANAAAPVPTLAGQVCF
jgi:hypothetical protein